MIKPKIDIRLIGVMFAATSLLGCEDLKIDSCQDAGGQWVEEIGECECTYEERGNYDIHITEEELKACMKPRPKKEGQEIEKSKKGTE